MISIKLSKLVELTIIKIDITKQDTTSIQSYKLKTKKSREIGRKHKIIVLTIV